MSLQSQIDVRMEKLNEEVNELNDVSQSGSTTPRLGAQTPSDSLSNVDNSHYYNDRIRALEGEKLSIMIEHNNLIKEFNKRMESHMDEIRGLKDANMQFEVELKDLQELSVFLDDDRRKCRKLAKEWQRFGRNTVSVMRGEISGYQDKIRVLETRQSQLIKENSELRDLCVYLDQQRSGAIEGQINGLNYVICQECSQLKKEHGTIQRSPIKGLPGKNFSADQVHDLQNQIAQLEKEKDSLHKLLMYGGKSRRDKKRVSFSVPTDEEYDSSSTTSEMSDRLEFPPSFGGSQDNFSVIMEASSVPSILRNGSYPSLNGPKYKLSDISPRNNDLNRLQQRPSLNEDELDEIRAKLSRSTMGEATLSEREIIAIKDMCHIASQKGRSNSNASNSSFNNSFDQSPLSPPPPINGVPLYGSDRPALKPEDKEGGAESQPAEKEESNTKESVEKAEPPLPSYDEIMRQTRSEPQNENETAENQSGDDKSS